jgi:hypothetical protein
MLQDVARPRRVLGAGFFRMVVLAAAVLAMMVPPIRGYHGGLRVFACGMRGVGL